MLYSNSILNHLGKELSDLIGKNLSTTNYKKHGTIEQYRDFCIDNWSTLQMVHDELIDLDDLQRLLSKRTFSKWHFFSLIMGDPVDDFLKR